MNQRQRMILTVSAGLIALMLIYPPFQIMGRGMGYSWLFSPPHEAAIINAGQLLVQWVAVILIGGISYLLSRDGQAPEKLRSTATAPTNAVPGIALSTTFTVLRVIRGIAGIVGIMQIVGLLPLFSLITNQDSMAQLDFGKLAALAFVKFIVALICLGIFIGLRSFMNRMHMNRYGVQHPSLARRWGL